MQYVLRLSILLTLLFIFSCKKSDDMGEYRRVESTQANESGAGGYISKGSTAYQELIIQTAKSIASDTTKTEQPYTLKTKLINFILFVSQQLSKLVILF